MSGVISLANINDNSLSYYIKMTYILNLLQATFNILKVQSHI